ncbi:hypothetical protein C8A05DRAFT_33800 [Staphylotrichum tortipilum]|uniref:Uncharacterized protein n=1 Tax=Staphylotrichum tortipilum TaxID=2831512 RepID=A0AAN6RTL0_9PEZI|nr:hypothetical protein C8A05DRAFT_33800 [Staphylotrichum longicolle]
MKYFTAALALAATALAVPTDPQADTTACTFGTYRCTTPNTGIEVCDISGSFVMVGPCPNGTACENLPQNGFTLPFCTNTAKVTRRDGRNRRPQHSPENPQPGDKCTTPGQYQCLGKTAIQVCDVAHILEKVGNCPAGSHCAYIGAIPYCVADGF